MQLFYINFDVNYQNKIDELKSLYCHEAPPHITVKNWYNGFTLIVVDVDPRTNSMKVIKQSFVLLKNMDAVN